MTDQLYSTMGVALWAHRGGLILLALAAAACTHADLFGEGITPHKYHHPEYEQLGYSPAYCAGGRPSFDAQGRPYMIVSYPFARGEPPQTTVPGHYRHLMFLRGDGWHFADLEGVLRRHFGDEGSLAGCSKQPEFIHETDEMFLLVQYRRADGAYALALITSPDHCESFAVHVIEDGHSAPYNRIASEHFAGHNRIAWPILIAVSRQGERPAEPAPDFPGILRYHILDRVGEKVVSVGDGTLSEAASSNPIGSMYVTTQIVSTPSRTHIAWHDTEADVERGGNKTYMRTYDKRIRSWSERTFVGPSQDDHGFPAVALDSRGYIHILCGAHASQVYYTRSTAPDDTSAFGPLEPIPGVTKGTHLSLVCDLEDRLHLFFRDNIGMGPDRKGLGYVRRDAAWGTVRRVASSPEGGYCRMCNHLSMDKRGRLLLNYGYFTLNYRAEGKVEGWYYPVLAYSADRGDTWSLVPDDFGLPSPGTTGLETNLFYLGSLCATGG
jgi:hypothetical protein